MRVKIKHKRGKQHDAFILAATKKELKSLSKDWKFDWKKLYDVKSKFYKILFEDEIQGLIKLEPENNSYFVLKNIEVSPNNFGSKGKYQNIAELLISYACLKSFELNEGDYKGFLVFTSKGALIEYYETKYGAELIFRDRMIIAATTGKELIKNHLKIDLDNE